MKRSEGNFLMATTFRTRYANAIFQPAKVAAAIDDAAMQGLRHHRIVQEHPFDLSDTSAAHALEDWLDQEQFRYVWRPCYIEQDPLRPDIVSEYAELVVSW